MSIISGTRLPVVIDFTAPPTETGDALRIEGPWVYANWIAHDKGKKEEVTFEFPLFTDTHITAHILSGCGPYLFLNAFPAPRDGFKESIIVRASNHMFFKVHPRAVGRGGETESTGYNAGDELDEIAALVALAAGARMEAGGVTREFELGDDLRGMPRAVCSRPNDAPTWHGKKMVLPFTVRSVDLSSVVPIISTLPRIGVEAMYTLVQSARLYQKAINIAETDANQAWLFLVSAIETAANYWKKGDDAPSERLKASKPELADYLLSVGGVEALEKVADAIVDSLGSTSKFINFIWTFRPDEPPARSTGDFQVKWSGNTLKPALGKIYNYRSKALHVGTAFPAPMCDAPFSLSSPDIFAERPLSAGFTTGHWWNAEDLPMYLWLFEYLVRNALLNWWASLAASPGTEAIDDVTPPHKAQVPLENDVTTSTQPKANNHSTDVSDEDAAVATTFEA